MYVDMYVGMYVCMYVGRYVCMYVCVFTVSGLFLRDIQNCVRPKTGHLPKVESAFNADGPVRCCWFIFDSTGFPEMPQGPQPSACSSAGPAKLLVNGEFMDNKSNIWPELRICWGYTGGNYAILVFGFKPLRKWDCHWGWPSRFYGWKQKLHIRNHQPESTGLTFPSKMGIEPMEMVIPTGFPKLIITAHVRVDHFF